MRKKIVFLLLVFSTSLSVAFAQVTKIMGNVMASDTKEPIPFVNLILKGTNNGATSNFEGVFSIQSKSTSDTLIVSCIGYQSQRIKINTAHFQKIEVYLVPNSTKLSEFVVRYSGNPADRILDSIIKFKSKNNSFDYDYIEYEAYNKVQFDMNNIDEKFTQKKAFRKFDFIFDYLDTSTVNGKIYLPFFLSETISNVYLRKNPKTSKEYINGLKISGLENQSISQFMGDLFLNINIYNNYIPLFDKSFVSPIADFGGSFYRYYLTDSAEVNSKWSYNISFKPKRPQELTFSGNFWVADTSWAVQNIKMNVAKEANLNFINGLEIEQSFDKIDSTHWVIVNDNVVVDFNAFENAKSTTGFYGHKTTSYKSHVIQMPRSDAFYNTPMDVITNDSALNRSETYWQQTRHDSLSKDERTIYYMIDTLKSLPIVKTYIEIVETVINGYKTWNKVEIGPYMSFLSFNQTEGTRIRIGGRTSNDFSKTLQLSAHLAYGTKDTRLKYAGSFLYLFEKFPRISIGGGIKNDMEQLGQSDNAFREDFLLASLFRRSDVNKLSMVDQYHLFYEREWLNGFSARITYLFRDIFPLDNSRFILQNNLYSSEIKNITTSEAILKLRYAYKERFVAGEFLRASLGTKYPIITLQYNYGIPDLFGGNFEFHKAKLFVEHWFNVGTFGWSKYYLEVGKIFTKLPYPLLKMHEGNETWFFDPMSFNTMNYYEFISDQYLSLSYTHHFDGLILNKIPLMRKLKWREVGYFKGLIGSLDNKNKNYSLFPAGLTELSTPFYEAGVGVENIFKFIRVDALWRLSHRENVKSNFGIFASFQFQF